MLIGKPELEFRIVSLDDLITVNSFSVLWLLKIYISIKNYNLRLPFNEEELEFKYQIPKCFMI